MTKVFKLTSDPAVRFIYDGVAFDASVRTLSRRSAVFGAMLEEIDSVPKDENKLPELKLPEDVYSGSELFRILQELHNPIQSVFTMDFQDKALMTRYIVCCKYDIKNAEYKNCGCALDTFCGVDNRNLGFTRVAEMAEMLSLANARKDTSTIGKLWEIKIGLKYQPKSDEDGDDEDGDDEDGDDEDEDEDENYSAFECFMINYGKGTLYNSSNQLLKLEDLSKETLLQLIKWLAR
jgi:hypothetical protein